MKPAQGPGHKPDRVFPSAKISFAFALQVGLSRLGGSKTGGSLLSQKKGWLSQDSAGLCQILLTQLDAFRNQICFCALETGRIISAPAPPAHHGAAHARRPLFCPGPTRLAANKVKPFFSMGG
jgi:hypothetical protein